MRIQVIVCQNAGMSGTPDKSRKALSETFQPKMFHYVCEEYSKDYYIKDFYNGCYTFREAFDFEVGEIKDNFKKHLLDQLASKGNYDGAHKILSQDFFQTEANELLKHNKWMVNEEAVQASSKLRK